MTEDRTTFWSTRTLMSGSAVFMAVLGLAAAFFPGEILGWLGSAGADFGILLVKVVGGLYFGFAILNWMARRNAIGGIYSRPVAMANLVHFIAVALVFVKRLPDTSHLAAYALIGLANAGFAAGFGWILFCGREGAEGASCG